MASRRTSKRIIVCCDGTWMNVLGAKSKEPPSNVSRMMRTLKNTCIDGTTQVVMYHGGVGSSGRFLDSAVGGTFGMGLDQDIKDLYNFICSNYADGDDIILVGFSRGAFTARSVADLVASLGLLTMDGFDHFLDIFEDYEHLGSEHRELQEYLFPGLEPYKGQKGKERIEWESKRGEQYRKWLKEAGYTRDTIQNGKAEITVKALGVWDTVGSLGIPAVPVIGLHGSAKQWRFTNTQISDKVENAFQALALDEPRYSFRPALWERVHGNRTHLKQVWFPGNHGNVGGGWEDQQIADISLAWMCDQLSTVGVEFFYSRLRSTFISTLRFSAAHPFPHTPTRMSSILHRFDPLPWAREGIFSAADAHLKRDSDECPGDDKHPDGSPPDLWRTARPWGLGQLRNPSSALQLAAGTMVRRPGLFMRVDPESNEDTKEPLLRTDERVHSCVRVRLACGGLGMDDKETWECEALLKDENGKAHWRLERASGVAVEEGLEQQLNELKIGEEAYPSKELYPLGKQGGWRWVFVGEDKHGRGAEDRVPQTAVLPEEPLVGYWERLLLGLTVGSPDVWQFVGKDATPGTGSVPKH